MGRGLIFPRTADIGKVCGRGIYIDEEISFSLRKPYVASSVIPFLLAPSAPGKRDIDESEVVFFLLK